MQDVLTSCEHCAHRFEVRRAAAGSLQNCPSCGKATRIPGESDPAWLPVQLIALGLCVAAGVLAFLVSANAEGRSGAIEDTSGQEESGEEEGSIQQQHNGLLPHL